jgi:tetratricopeptide (TPR) repeat protein
MGLTALLGLGIFAATGQFRTTDLGHASLEDLEKRIVGSTDGRVWMAYGDKLRQTDKFEAAAKAYERALELQPDLNDARLKKGMALGQAADANAFFAYVAKLSGTYPKLAVDLMARPEVSGMRADPRWDPAQTAAQAQAVD